MNVSLGLVEVQRLCLCFIGLTSVVFGRRLVLPNSDSKLERGEAVRFSISMANSQFKKARITGVVTCVPKTERLLDDELELFGGNAKQLARLKKTIGLDRRRVVDPDTTSLDLCEAATRRLLKETGAVIESIDALIFVTQTPDHPQPCNAALLHGRLELQASVAALDVNLGCSGYVYGLWLAHMMIESGGCQRVLLLAGDTISRVVNPRDRATAPLFGDGGSATLVEKDEQAPRSFFCLNTDGRGAKHLIVPAGGQRCPTSPATVEEFEDEGGNIRSGENLFMDGAEIFNFSITEEPKAVKDLVDYAGVSLESVDYFVFHQANRYILSNIAKRLKLDVDKVPMRTVECFGNQSSASIPSAICGELSEPLSVAKSRKILLSGFGVGLSWASCLVEFNGLKACSLIDYEPEARIEA